ncbi:hypothetical protein WOLCODRAFT_140210 [Wolfiporia cocos MD-104 SS10]|uniref:X-box-binding protein 1 n=1 Tax=Wolfiporia cocos (strain MD-104) TaxID=742152 RepID=A0A2H3J1F5_WOLCO|nr:hypothetical protein WOLCODRAFT_140210 [Wolfiporia cocos MD-104 SS10]
MKRAADSDNALPSPPAESSQSPAPSTSQSPGPSEVPRKRVRSDATPEERREARAHRNRIAAQNSRDRRKAQFSYLERRVAELEEENRQLRAGMGLMGLRRAEEHRVEEQREKDRTREKENEELRERIKTLESGWDAVVKALAASGLPMNIPQAPSASTSSTSSASTSAPTPAPAPAPAPSTTASPSSPPPTTTTFPVLVPPSPTSIFSHSPAPSEPSHMSSSASPYLLDLDDFASARHLARVANTGAPLLSPVPLQRVEQTPRQIAITSNLSSGSNSASLLQLFRRQPLLAKSRLPQPWTKWSWRTSSARSSRLLPLSRPQHCLLVLRQQPRARPLHKRHRRRPPGPRRR